MLWLWQWANGIMTVPGCCGRDTSGRFVSPCLSHPHFFLTPHARTCTEMSCVKLHYGSNSSIPSSRSGAAVVVVVVVHATI